MFSDSYDAIVVGGGPAGLRSALPLVRAGVRTVLFEKKLEFESPIRGGEGIADARARGRYAAETILAARQRRDFSRKSLADYRKRLEPRCSQLKKKYNQVFKPVVGIK